MNNSIKILGMLLLSLTMIQPANAAFISRDWSNLNDSAITFDTITGIEWLDLSETVGLTFTDVLAQTGVGGEYYGWRYANLSEVETLFTNFGFELASQHLTPVTQEELDSINQISSFMGDTLGNWYDTWQSLPGYGSGVWGITGEFSETRPDRLYSFYAQTADYDETFILQSDNYTIHYEASAQDYLGSFLVAGIQGPVSFPEPPTTTVPLPASVWLFASGLVGLLGFRKRT